jgi:ribonucleotide reductase alpha subunit
MPISCFGIDVDDSIEGIADSNSELMRLSSQGGGVGIGMYLVSEVEVKQLKTMAHPKV